MLLSWLPQTPSVRLLYPYLFLDIIPMAMMISSVVEFTNDAFGDDVFYINALKDCAQSMISVFSSAIIGSLSDSIGRKPLLIMLAIANTVPTFVLGLTMNAYAYVGAQMVACVFGGFSAGGGSAGFSLMSAYVADTTPVGERGAAFGRVLAIFGLAFAVVPLATSPLANLLGTQNMAWAAFAIRAMVPFYIYFFVPESLKKPERHGLSFRKVLFPPGFREAVRTISASRFLTILVALNFLTAFSDGGVKEFTMTYCVKYIHFEKLDSSIMVSMFGVTSLVAQGLVVPFLSAKRVPETYLILVATVLNMVHCVLYGLANAKWIIFLGIALGSIAFLGPPSISALASKGVSKHEQGAVAGVFQSTKSVTGIFAPLLMGYMFTDFNRFPAPFDFAGVAFILSAVLLSFCTILAVILLRAKVDVKADADLLASHHADKSRNIESETTTKSPLLSPVDCFSSDIDDPEALQVDPPNRYNQTIFARGELEQVFENRPGPL
eukprot:GILK01006369.1.p1 GENE.GILK01006369.1~~GILK01006369.1.p1  ORF type:complete len:494 (-),score=59.50 GILK01006369.1:197-1678(-)